MKTFKQHVKEGYKQDKYGAGNVGSATSDAVEDSALSLITYKILMFLKELTLLLVLLQGRIYETSICD